MKHIRIDDYPELTEQLGKARTDRIRYYQKGTSKRQVCATNIENPIQEQMLELEYFARLYEIDDILTCAALLVDDNSRPLNRHRLIVLLQSLPIINTKQIELLMNIQTRQAQYYMRAAKFALPHLVKHFDRRAH